MCGHEGNNRESCADELYGDESGIFDKANGINYRGTWMPNRAYLNVMMKQESLSSHNPEVEGRRQRGGIVNLSSGLGVIGMPKNRKSFSYEGMRLTIEYILTLDHLYMRVKSGFHSSDTKRCNR